MPWRALIVLPPLAVVWLLWGVSLIPSFDHWAELDLYVRLMDGRAGGLDLLRPDRLHSVVAPRAFRTALAFATDWSLMAEAGASFALALATYWGVGRIALHGAQGRARRHAWVAVGASGVLLFSPVHYLAWYWTVSFVHFLMNACMVLAAWQLQRAGGPPRRRDLVAAAGLCGVASLTRAEGVLSWLLLLPLVAARMQGEERAKRVVIAWSGAAIAVPLTVLGVGLRFGERAASAAPEPAAALVLALDTLGAPLVRFRSAWMGGDSETASYAAVGALLLASFAGLAVASLRGPAPLRARALPWLCLGGFGATFAFGVGTLRAAMMEFVPAQHFFLSMYALGAVLFPVAIVQLAALHLGERGGDLRWAAARITALAGLGFCLVANYAVYGRIAAETRWVLLGADVCIPLVHHLDSVNTCFVQGPSPVFVRRLERSGFREIRRDVVLVPEPRRRHGAITGDKRRSSEHRLRGIARLHGTQARPRAILLSRAGHEGFFAIGRVVRNEGESVRWEARVPATFYETDAPLVHAWVYDEERGRIVRLEGERRLATETATVSER